MTGGTADVTARRNYDGEVEEVASLPVQNGQLTVHVQDDGRVVIDELDLSLGDIHLTEQSVPPTGLDLKDVRLSLKNTMPEQTRWTADGYASVVDGTVVMLLDWSLENDAGELVPLATQRIDDVPLQIDIVPDHSGHLRAVIHATRDGVFWGWTGLLELSDLQLDVDTKE